MTFRQLMDFLSTMYAMKDEHDGDEIVARLVWRNEHGVVNKERYAKFGKCTGLYPELRVEMDTVKHTVDELKGEK